MQLPDSFAAVQTLKFGNVCCLDALFSKAFLVETREISRPQDENLSVVHGPHLPA